MCDRYPGYLFGGTPVSSWDRSFNSLENQIQQQYRGRAGPNARYWGSMSEGGGVSAVGGGDSCKTNLIVNYLPQSMTEKDLYAMFMTIGPIESCRVMKDFKTGYSYGFGFVNFTREEDASRAIETFNGYQLRNKRLKVSYARPSGDDIKETNLYVTNLPRAITEDQLETIFGKYGRIVQKHILRDKSNGTPRGVAFVRFDKREEAQEAIAALNNVIPEGGTEPLSVKVAEEHGKQKAAYYAGWAAGFHHNRAPVGTALPPRQHSLDQLDKLDMLHRREQATLPAWLRRTPAPPVLPPRQHSLDQLDMLHRREQGALPTWLKRRDYAWNCGSCMVPEPWEQFPSTPLGGSHPNTPRNGCRPNCANRMGYPNYMPGKATPRSARGGRNPPWAPGFEERYKGQRCRNGPTPYW